MIHAIEKFAQALPDQKADRISGSTPKFLAQSVRDLLLGRALPRQWNPAGRVTTKTSCAGGCRRRALQAPRAVRALHRTRARIRILAAEEGVDRA